MWRPAVAQERNRTSRTSSAVACSILPTLPPRAFIVDEFVNGGKRAHAAPNCLLLRKISTAHVLRQDVRHLVTEQLRRICFFTLQKQHLQPCAVLGAHRHFKGGVAVQNNHAFTAPPDITEERASNATSRSSRTCRSISTALGKSLGRSAALFFRLPEQLLAAFGAGGSLGFGVHRCRKRRRRITQRARRARARLARLRSSSHASICSTATMTCCAMLRCCDAAYSFSSSYSSSGNSRTCKAACRLLPPKSLIMHYT